MKNMKYVLLPGILLLVTACTATTSPPSAVTISQERFKEVLVNGSPWEGRFENMHGGGEITMTVTKEGSGALKIALEGRSAARGHRKGTARDVKAGAGTLNFRVDQPDLNRTISYSVRLNADSSLSGEITGPESHGRPGRTFTNPVLLHPKPKTQSGDWLSGEWTGLRQERFIVSTTLRLVYEPTTGKIIGSGDFVNLDLPGVSAKANVEGSVTRDAAAKKVKVTLKMKHIGGRADGQTFTFELERRDDGSLYGQDLRGKATLSLVKK